MTSEHNRRYHPSFPQLSVTLRSSDDRRLGPFSALVDTGADITFVPNQLLEQLSLWDGEEVNVRSHFGEPKRLRLYLVNVEISDRSLSGLYVVADEVGNEIILGRDVLGKLSLFFDGPAEITELLDDASINRLRARRTR
jgi:predicted aspartyl protease